MRFYHKNLYQETSKQIVISDKVYAYEERFVVCLKEILISKDNKKALSYGK
jgi:hypothetical protein